MKTPFLDFYNECLKNGRLKEDGICLSFKGNSEQWELIKLFQQYNEVFGLNWYWGYSGSRYSWFSASKKQQLKIMHTFTPMRQNVILLCAAINNEL